MSNFKNLHKAREYKERSQPAARERFGLLEKKKDYRERAKNFHGKERRLQAMKVKAAFRNPDEFYHKMSRTKTNEDGLHRTVNAEMFTSDELQLMRSQDLGYLTAQTQMEQKKIDRAQATLHLLTAAKPFTHTVFLDEDEDGASGTVQVHGQQQQQQQNKPKRKGGKTAGESAPSGPSRKRGREEEEEDGSGSPEPVSATAKANKKARKARKAVARFDPAQYFDTVPEALSRTYNRPTVRQLSEGGDFVRSFNRSDDAEVNRAQRKEQRVRTKQQAAQYRRLGSRVDRLKKLQNVQQVLSLQQQLSLKGRHKRVKAKSETANGIPVFKWVTQRKK